MLIEVTESVPISRPVTKNPKGGKVRVRLRFRKKVPGRTDTELALGTLAIAVIVRF